MRQNEEPRKLIVGLSPEAGRGGHSAGITGRDVRGLGARRFSSLPLVWGGRSAVQPFPTVNYRIIRLIAICC